MKNHKTPEIVRMIHLLNKGYKPNELGKVISPRGKEVIKKNKYNKTKGNAQPYIQIQLTINKKHNECVKAHRYVFFYHHGYLPDIIDHINGNSLDNRIENLREATASLNAQNRKNVRGYWQTRNGKFSVSICAEKKRKYCGTFSTEEEARNCYLYWKSKLHKG